MNANHIIYFRADEIQSSVDLSLGVNAAFETIAKNFNLKDECCKDVLRSTLATNSIFEKFEFTNKGNPSPLTIERQS